MFFDQASVYPGNVFEMTLATILKDSSEILSTESGLTVNFADYSLELKGPVKRELRARKVLEMRVSDEAYLNPEITISISLRKKPSIQYTVTVPVRYDVVQRIKYAGEDGYDPRSSTNNGYKKVNLFANINLEYIDNEQTLSNNSDPRIIGGRGPDMDVYIETAPKNKEFLKVDVNVENGDKYTKYIWKGKGTLEIVSTGGRGGISKSGGKGGDGGDVTVHIRPEDKVFFNQVFILNFGGDGGELWRPKVDGQQLGPFGNDGKVTVVDW